MKTNQITPWNWFSRSSILNKQNRARDWLSPFNYLQQELEDVFSRFDEDFAPFQLMKHREGKDFWYPKVDIIETDSHYKITADIPGVRREDINMSINSNNLIIEGERKETSENNEGSFHRIEKLYGQFRRVFSLPQNADVNQVSARFQDGVLNIDIAKLQEGAGSEVKKIELTG